MPGFDDASPNASARTSSPPDTPTDDQAETVLLRLLRGSGARGLSGIRVQRGMYVRPLLDCRRHDLRAYLQEMGEAWREDDSNAEFAPSHAIGSGTS